MAVESGDRPQWSGGAQGNKVRVLLIDEDPDGLVYNSTLLQSLGCEVWACWSYADGVQDLQEESWDIVVVSQGSPAFEGRCILERASTTGCKIPVFVLAPSLDTHCYLEAMQLGAADYLEEPVSASEMRSILDTYGPVRIPPRLKRTTLTDSGGLAMEAISVSGMLSGNDLLEAPWCLNCLT